MAQKQEDNMARVRRSISFNPELLERIDTYVKEHYEYKDRSHFIEVIVRRYFEREKGEG